MGVQITPLEAHAWMLCCSWKLPEATIWLCVTPPLRRMNELVPCSKLPEALSDSLSLTQKVGGLVKHACTSTTLHSFTRKLVSHCNCPQPDQKIKTQGHRRGNSIYLALSMILFVLVLIWKKKEKAINTKQATVHKPGWRNILVANHQLSALYHWGQKFRLLCFCVCCLLFVSIIREQKFHKSVPTRIDNECCFCLVQTDSA